MPKALDPPTLLAGSALSCLETTFMSHFPEYGMGRVGLARFAISVELFRTENGYHRDPRQKG